MTESPVQPHHARGFLFPGLFQTKLPVVHQVKDLFYPDIEETPAAAGISLLGGVARAQGAPRWIIQDEISGWLWPVTVAQAVAADSHWLKPGMSPWNSTIPIFSES